MDFRPFCSMYKAKAIEMGGESENCVYFREFQTLCVFAVGTAVNITLRTTEFSIEHITHTHKNTQQRRRPHSNTCERHYLCIVMGYVDRNTRARLCAYIVQSRWYSFFLFISICANKEHFLYSLRTTFFATCTYVRTCIKYAHKPFVIDIQLLDRKQQQERYRERESSFTPPYFAAPPKKSVSATLELRAGQGRGKNEIKTEIDDVSNGVSTTMTAMVRYEQTNGIC